MLCRSDASWLSLTLADYIANGQPQAAYTHGQIYVISNVQDKTEHCQHSAVSDEQMCTMHRVQSTAMYMFLLT